MGLNNQQSTNDKEASIIERIPWKKSLQQISIKLLAVIIFLAIFLFLYYYSLKINPVWLK